MSKGQAITIGKVKLTAARHAKILAWVNKERAKMDLLPLTKLRNGEPSNATACPMANSLNPNAKALKYAGRDHGVSVGYKIGSGYWPSGSYWCKFVRFPKFVHEFHEEMMNA